MVARKVTERIDWVGAVDWNRRLFDELIPLPEGTSYNAYLVKGSEKTALIDTVDPDMKDHLLTPLRDVAKIDYIVSNHAEQDHSGTLPDVLELYPESIILCSAKAKPMLIDHLQLDPDRIRVVEDGEKVSLGGLTLEFVYTPWVHWPETMSTLVPEEKVLFTCDFFGSHLATSKLFVGNDPSILRGAARYYAEIMMPFRAAIKGNMKKVDALDYDMIAPSHGPIYDYPEIITEAYHEWISDDNYANRVVIPYTSMHGTIETMVDYLVQALIERGVEAQKFNLTVTDLGDLAISLIDAATVVVGASTVHMHAHPTVSNTVNIFSAIRPKTKHLGILASYGWATKIIEQLAGKIEGMKQLEVLEPVLCKGLPTPDDRAAIDRLADTIRDRHSAMGLL